MINDERACLSLIDAIYWYSIVDVVSALRFYKQHGRYDKENESDRIKKMRQTKTVNYESAIIFLKNSSKGQRMLDMLNNLTEEQMNRVLDKGGLAVYEQ